MKKLKISGRFWQEDQKWVAHIPSLELMIHAPSSFLSLVQIKEEVENEIMNKEFECTISVLDEGIFYLNFYDNEIFQDYIRIKSKKKGA